MNTNTNQQDQVKAAAAGTIPARRPDPGADQLKAERVQIRVEPPSRPLDFEGVRERLAAMPGWRLASGKSVGRVRDFPDPGMAAAYAGSLAQLAVKAGYPVAIGLTGSRVTVTVSGRVHEGLTEGALSFAQGLN